MRIAFIRSIDVSQAKAYLSQIGDFVRERELKVKIFYTDGNCTPEQFPGEVEKIDNPTVEETVKRVVSWGADRVISISIPDNNSFRDSVAKEHFEQRNIPTIMHPISATNIMCNKWETNRFLANIGVRVPAAFLIDGDLLGGKSSALYPAYSEYLSLQATKIGFPLIVKPLSDSMSCGIQIVSSISEFRSLVVSGQISASMIAEEYIHGELFGIEVLGKEGRFRTLGLIKKPISSRDNLMPFNNIRFTAALYPEKYSQLESTLFKVAEKLNICGSIDVEMIRRDGEFYIIEINPRVSGMSNLSSSVSGLNIYEELIRLALDERRSSAFERPKQNLVAEFPLRKDSDIDLVSSLALRSAIIDISSVEYHDESRQTKVLLKFSSIADLFRKVSLLSGCGLVDDYICEVLKRELEGNSEQEH